MGARIEDYALIGDCETAALVSREGSLDWLCWPRFDSGACFAALLGEPEHGRWLITPRGEAPRISRRYLPDTLVLETTFETPTGRAALIDFMPPRGRASDVVRIVAGLEGEVDMRMQLVLRFGYGAVTPWVTRMKDGGLRAIGGPDMTVLRTPVPLRGENMTTVSEFTVRAGQRIPFVLTYSASHLPPPSRVDAEAALEQTRAFWTDWISRTSVDGPYAEVMRRSLITLKAMTYAPTGGLVAAPTTSLPERFGGERNWDYRYCWIRDATLTLLALMNCGHHEEARAWIAWLHRAVAGEPAAVQIMYGIGAERRLTEWTVDWLPGYEDSKPVRIGNAAHHQFQLDVYGELMDAFHQACRAGLPTAPAWDVQVSVVEHVAKVWEQPDEGIWEVRGPAQHFTFSKVMAWVVMDRAVKAVETFGRPGRPEEWRRLRDAIREDVLARGFDARKNAFKRSYEDDGADASLLLLAELGFVAPDDPKFAGTVAAVERELLFDEVLVRRYDTRKVDDGLPPGEGAFLPCSFWLANAYVMLGRTEDARRLFERLLQLCNDLGLVSEEYAPEHRRLAGNFPQAFTHVGLLSTALNLMHGSRPSEQRSERESAAGARPGADAAA
jgi:GH15 family glucan-1,4-alpha-glucosidase